MRLVSFRLGAVLLVLLVCGHAGQSFAAARRPFGGSISLPLIDRLDSTDPTRIRNWNEWQIAAQVHETLFVQREGRIVPALAQRMPEVMDGGREILITIRPEATFHDGTEVTSKEVIASWQRLLKSDPASGHWWLLAPVQGAIGFHQGQRNRITGLEQVNKVTLRIRLEIPAADFLPVLCASPTAILPMSELRREGGPTRHPLGAGPFRWVEGEEGQSLKAFEDHWRGRPYLDSIQLEAFETMRDATLAFELGKVDLALTAPPGRNAGFQNVQFPVNQLVLLVINEQRTRNFPEGFRRALSMAVDRESLANYIVGDRGQAFDELIVTGELRDGTASIASDQEKAKAYFKSIAMGRMGVPTMLEFIVRKSNAFERSVAERIQVNLAAVGVSVAISELDHEEYEGRLAAASFDLRLERPLPLVDEAALQFVGVTAQVEEAGQVEDLLQMLDRLPVDGNRAGILRERARGLQARFPWMPLFVYGHMAFSRERVQELNTDGRGVMMLDNAWLVR